MIRVVTQAPRENSELYRTAAEVSSSDTFGTARKMLRRDLDLSRDNDDR